ncbi:PIG-L family deacetylase [Candidatus Gottesmanbacteria bacterium]|nr:PIG-L family deacetylase [Candidatus Gottesmanbacteria bacterium]
MEIPTDSYNRIFENKSRILVVMPHPDDTELYCGATVARLTQSGKRVRVVKMTFGDKGSRQEKVTQRELRRIREKEDREAMKVLGIKDEDNIYIGLGDGEIEHDLETIGKVVYQIRLFKPELIITTNPEDYIIRFDKDINWVNHRDHRHTGRIAVDAAYPYARDLLFFPEHLKKKHITVSSITNDTVSSHACTEFLFTDVYQHPDLVYIDVTDYIDYRTKALAAHSSQYSLQHAQESTDFFTKLPQYGNRRFDRFRYVVAD